MTGARLSILFAAVALSPTVGLCQGDPEPSPEEVVNGFHESLASGDEEGVLATLDAEVVIFESGGAELSRDEYASHHLGADMEFSAATQRDVIDQQVGQSGDLAWVLTRSQTNGTFRGKDIDARGAETILLRHTPEGWRIMHIHWSSRSSASE
jgi:ketosteroid isomerase-like protein